MLQKRQESTRKLRSKQESLDDQLHVRTMDERPRPFNDQTKKKDSAIRRQLSSSSTHPEFKVCHTTVPATKHNFKDTTNGPGYHHELQAELPPPSNFKVDRQP
jgi:hypothetical protein